MALPTFRYHPDPLRSGSIVASDKPCRCCGTARGYVYAGPAYCEAELDESLCPWCIADGSAHRKFDATFVDAAVFADETPEAVVEEVSERTPGFSTWQSDVWPTCCEDATAFIAPAGIAEIRGQFRELEGEILNHIVYEMDVSGGAATRVLQSLNRDGGPTAYVFKCLHCERNHFHVDGP
jgi:uncharacterized protein CbrC (UPF0167 family)